MPFLSLSNDILFARTFPLRPKAPAVVRPFEIGTELRWTSPCCIWWQENSAFQSADIWQFFFLRHAGSFCPNWTYVISLSRPLFACMNGLRMDVIPKASFCCNAVAWCSLWVVRHRCHDRSVAKCPQKQAQTSLLQALEALEAFWTWWLAALHFCTCYILPFSIGLA